MEIILKLLEKLGSRSTKEPLSTAALIFGNLTIPVSYIDAVWSTSGSGVVPDGSSSNCILNAVCCTSCVGFAFGLFSGLSSASLPGRESAVIWWRRFTDGLRCTNEDWLRFMTWPIKARFLFEITMLLARVSFAPSRTDLVVRSMFEGVTRAAGDCSRLRSSVVEWPTADFVNLLYNSFCTFYSSRYFRSAMTTFGFAATLSFTLSLPAHS